MRMAAIALLVACMPLGAGLMAADKKEKGGNKAKPTNVNGKVTKVEVNGTTMTITVMVNGESKSYSMPVNVQMAVKEADGQQSVLNIRPGKAGPEKGAKKEPKKKSKKKKDDAGDGDDNL